MEPVYQSDIPEAAVKRFACRELSRMECYEYYIGDTLVGRRWFDCGALDWEQPIRNGKIHGTAYTFWGNGSVHHTEPYVDGKIHGTSCQWTPDGRLIGTYTFEHGTGIDLWWTPCGCATCSGETADCEELWVVSEVHPCKDG